MERGDHHRSIELQYMAMCHMVCGQEHSEFISSSVAGHLYSHLFESWNFVAEVAFS